MPRTLALAVGVAGAAPALVAGLWPGLLAGVCLTAWSLAEAAKQVWEHLLLHPGPLPGWPGAAHACFEGLLFGMRGLRGREVWQECLRAQGLRWLLHGALRG